MAFVVVYDACVLFPAPLRDLLIRVARTGVVQAHWSDQIIEECFRAVLRERTDLAPENLARTKALMNLALPDANVTGHEPLIDSFELPDPNDRHVLAAAVRIGAQAESRRAIAASIWRRVESSSTGLRRQWSRRSVSSSFPSYAAPTGLPSHPSPPRSGRWSCLGCSPRPHRSCSAISLHHASTSPRHRLHPSDGSGGADRLTRRAKASTRQRYIGAAQICVASSE